MDKFQIAIELMQAFPNSFINRCGEFIAHRAANEYFCLGNCESEIEVKCKVLEWFSRAAHKSMPFNSNNKNQKFHSFMLDGINTFLQTDFSENEISEIYDKLGNCVNRPLTKAFVESGYNMEVLRGGNNEKEKVY